MAVRHAFSSSTLVPFQRGTLMSGDVFYAADEDEVMDFYVSRAAAPGRRSKAGNAFSERMNAGSLERSA
eukprot:4123756-Alexandrium_andersonii.AAC.1